MEETAQLDTIIVEMLQELLLEYDARVPEQSEFADLRTSRSYYFGDPGVTLPGWVELVVMHMDARLDPRYNVLRFMSVRVMKSREGGFVSSTCLHGTKAELRRELEGLMEEPAFLVARVHQLAEGLPEETDPDLWR